MLLRVGGVTATAIWTALCQAVSVPCNPDYCESTCNILLPWTMQKFKQGLFQPHEWNCTLTLFCSHGLNLEGAEFCHIKYQVRRVRSEPALHFWSEKMVRKAPDLMRLLLPHIHIIRH
ncbi:hypothetical protein EI94DRAFT_783048 [Lactarius quietus]|nr:hypothetical protein EI94DRAFT_783048 [Lactarius quietus]